MSDLDRSRLNRNIRSIFEGGVSDPHEVADYLMDVISPEDYETVLRLVLPTYTRVMAGKQRKISEGTAKPVFVPSSGWKDMSELTASECLEIAAGYYDLADQNSAMAEEFESWAGILERSAVTVLGDLSEFKEYMSLRVKEGMARAKAAGRHVGRPSLTLPETTERITQLRQSMTLQQIADLFNIEGVKTVSGNPWSINSVFKQGK